MVEIFKELIANFHKSLIPKPVKRRLLLPTLPKDVHKVYVFIGMRRSGKTWSLYQIMHDLTGVDKTQLLYINFEDERISAMQTQNFQDIMRAYFELYPQYSDKRNIYFFFDEIHEIEGWEKFIRRVLDQERMHIYVTGSSCKLLSKEIASALRGRTIVNEIFPFNFPEYLKKLKIEVPKMFGTKQKSLMVHHLRNFLLWGGFPETIGTDAQTHRTLLQGYVASVIYRDVIVRYEIRSTKALGQLLAHGLRNSGTMFSITKVYNSLKSMGYEISKNTLYEYMAYFEDAYCIFSIPKYDLSQRKSPQSVKKIYAVDQGLTTAYTMESAFDLSSQLETAVFAYLRRQTSCLYYYKTADNKEVDFVQILPDQSRHLFQVRVSMKDEITRRRKITALKRAMQELKITGGTIVTIDEKEQINTEYGTIQVIPAWELFLESD